MGVRFTTLPPVAVQSIVVSVSVCLSVCLSVRLHISKTIRPNFTKFFVHVIRGRGSDASGFADDVMFMMFPYNVRNIPESKTTRVSHPLRQVATPVEHRVTLFGRNRQMAAPGRSLTFLTASCLESKLFCKQDAIAKTARIHPKPIEI